MTPTPTPVPEPSAPPAFEMVGDPDAEACVDGVCAVPAPAPAPAADLK